MSKGQQETRKRELHLTDITDLSYFAEEAVITALEHDCRFNDYGAFVEKVDYTREDAVLELQRLRGAGDPVFQVENGMWLGKSISDRIIEDFPEDIREYLRPKRASSAASCGASQHGTCIPLAMILRTNICFPYFLPNGTLCLYNWSSLTIGTARTICHPQCREEATNGMLISATESKSVRSNMSPPNTAETGCSTDMKTA